MKKLGTKDDKKLRKRAAERLKYASLSPEKKKEKQAKQRAWYAANKEAQRERCRANGRKYYLNNIEKQRAIKRRFLYGLEDDQYKAMLATQKGVCKICGRVSNTRNKNHLVVDHDHKTGMVRGLLCYRCNNAIGQLNDDPVLVSIALEYLLASQVKEAG